jgi:catalase
MPLPTDEKILALSNDILKTFDSIFGQHPGFRPAHAKGAMLTGIFTPSSGAASLTRAAHMNNASTPVSVRFSNSTGVPLIPDNDANANPRGLAIRFHLGEHVHTDIVSHSTDGFPTRTGQEFLEFLHALAASSDPAQPHPWPVEAYVDSHPSALAFVQAPKPAPSSFARETYYGVTAMHFTNKDGVSRFGRYRIIPEAGNDHLDDATVATKSPNYLFDELEERVAQGAIKFRVLVQLANDGDVVDDATIHWPDDRTVLELGTITLTEPVPDNAHEQKTIIFDPIPRLDGIAPSEDPLLELRAAVYLISGRRRRAAPEE